MPRASSLPVHATAGRDVRRVWMLPVCPRERDANRSALPGGGACPALPHDPGYERAPSHGLHPAPTRCVRPVAHVGEVDEERLRRWSLGGLDRGVGELGRRVAHRGTGAGPFPAALLGTAAGHALDPGTLDTE